jgi:energy-coupling factor transporter ATP-binding protein EcfA2
MEMDLHSVKPLVGASAKAKFDETYGMLEHTQNPLYFTGPSGSGKTAMAMALAKHYSMEHGVPAYYLQLSPDQTKTSIILGLRLVNGSLMPVKGTVATAMETGGIVVIDEATHTTQQMLLMFNGIMDRVSVTAIGDEIVYAKDSFRLIFCANDSAYAGNVRLPQSFAQRVSCFTFGYPTPGDENKIADAIFKSEYNGMSEVPHEVLRFIASFVREVRNPEFPLSARNIASAMIRLSLLPLDKSADIDKYFTIGNPEAMRRMMADRIIGAADSQNLVGPQVNTFVEYVSQVGVDKFRETVLQSVMFYLDVDGMDFASEETKTKIKNGVI